MSKTVATADGMLRVTLLGAFRVVLGRRAVPDAAWRRRKAAGLIKLLALAPAHRLHREQITEALWPDIDPAAAANNLHRTLHDARRLLTPHADSYLRLQRDMLNLAPDQGLWVDIDAFAAAATFARRAGTPLAYRAALELYGGDLLPEDRFEDWTALRREELRTLFLALLLEMSRLHVAQADHAAAVAALEHIVAIDPAHEEAHVELMRLFALGGHRLQALRQYEQMSAALKDELAVQPSAESKRLYEDIAAGREAPSSSLPPADTAGIDTWPATLPPQATSFVGREREMSAVMAQLASTRLLTLTGAGGTGKTRLAIQVAAHAFRAFADGVRLVDLVQIAEGSLVRQALMAALNLREEPQRAPDEMLAAALRDRHLLIILDNCEHLADDCASLAAFLLSRCPRLHLLATSRSPLRLDAEISWRVPALDLPTADAPPSPDSLLAHDAVRLFVERGRTAQSRFALTAQNAPSVTRICRSLDGLPLAIELAAARLRVLSVEEIAERLDNLFALLPAQRDMSTPHHRTLHAAIDWSHDLLGMPERLLFRRLAVFAGGWALAAGEAVCSGDGLDREAILDGLSALAEASLVVVEEHHQRTRYRLLEPIRQYAAGRLDASGEAPGLRQRHAEWCFALAREAQAELRGPDQASWLDRLDLEHDNVRAALAWTEATNQNSVRLELCATLGSFWLSRGYMREGRSFLDSVLRATEGTTQTDMMSVRAQALKTAGTFAYRMGDYAGATGHYDACLAAYQELDDAGGMADALNGLGIVVHHRGDLSRAEAFYERSLALSRASGSSRGVSNILTNLGVVAWSNQEYARATDLFQEGLDLCRSIGDRFGVAAALSNLGMVALAEGAYEQAHRFHQDSLAIRKELGDRRGLPISLANLAELAQAQADYVNARALYRESISLCQELGDTLGVVQRLEKLAQIAAACALHERAVSLCTATVAMRDALGAPLSAADREHHDRIISSARAALPEHRFAAAQAFGQVLTLDQAILEAMKADRPAADAVIEPVPTATNSTDARPLSQREREIAALVAAGRTNRQIAAELGIASRTVDTHVGKILEKLGCTSRAQVVERMRILETDNTS